MEKLIKRRGLSGLETVSSPIPLCAPVQGPDFAWQGSGTWHPTGQGVRRDAHTTDYGTDRFEAKPSATQRGQTQPKELNPLLQPELRQLPPIKNHS